MSRLRIVSMPVTASYGMALAFTVGLLAMPSPANATDIGWRATMSSGTMSGGKFNRQGTASYKTGEKAEFNSSCSDEPPDDKGRPNVKCDSVYRFKDGSSMTVRYAGIRDPATLTVSGSGEFTSGTGRFQGISGKATYSGNSGDAEWVGSYSLPAK